LLALIEEHDPGVERRFAGRGSRPADVLADVRRALGTGDDRAWDGILVTPRVRSVIARAESSVQNGALVEPGDLLDALFLESGGLAADVLAAHFGNTVAPGRVGG
jgi:hypothetical protein